MRNILLIKPLRHREFCLAETQRPVGCHEHRWSAVAGEEDACTHCLTGRRCRSADRAAGPLVIVTSALSQLNFGIDGFEFTAGIVDSHLPVDAALSGVDIV